MRFSDLCNKEVVNVNDCKCLGTVKDLDIDCDCGKILAIIVPGPGKYMGFLCREYDIWIPWVKICRIGHDIILADVRDCEMRHKI